jgi:hypothetical protein
VDAATTLGNVSTASFIAGGVFAAAGAVLLVLPAGGEQKPSAGAGARPMSPARWSAALGPGRLEILRRF